MASVQTVHMSMAQFRQEEDHFLQEMMERLSSIYVQEAESMLRQAPFGYKPAIAAKVARGVVLNGELIMSNSDSSDEEDESDLINDIGKQYAQKFRVALLLIQAPVVRDGKTLECDEQSRDLQYRNFVKIHPELNQENPKIYKSIETVYNYDGMKKKIEEFLKKTGTRACIASIAFNGHGNQRGLCFHNQSEGSESPLDTFIADIQQMIRDIRSPLGLPFRVELIFSQCFAHLYTAQNTPDFEVYHFTSETCTKTFVIEERDELTEDIVDAHHYQLEDHVPESQKAWAAANERMESETAQDDDGPATSIGGTTEGISKLEMS